MRWTKRLKWNRLSKIIIPIALAISLVFAGFTVYASEAENFVVRTNKDPEIKLSLATQRVRDENGECILDENGSYVFSDKTSVLNLPASGAYINITHEPDADLFYDSDDRSKEHSYNIPNDIAFYDGVHSGYNYLDQITFYSFSFFLINDSDRPVDVDMYLNLESVTYASNTTVGDHHVDDAIKILYMEGEHYLWNKQYDSDGEVIRNVDGTDVLDAGPFLIYSKKESSEENEQHLLDRIKYDDLIQPFDDDARYIFKREVSNGGGFMNMAPGEYKKFTLVMWLEGNDEDCDDYILGERMKMSIDFIGS